MVADLFIDIFHSVLIHTKMLLNFSKGFITVIDDINVRIGRNAMRENERERERERAREKENEEPRHSKNIN